MNHELTVGDLQIGLEKVEHNIAVIKKYIEVIEMGNGQVPDEKRIALDELIHSLTKLRNKHKDGIFKITMQNLLIDNAAKGR